MENLYETDFTRWLGQQRDLLAQGQFDQLDIPNLLEAMEIRMGDPVKELRSHLIILLLHLLKYDYQKRVLRDPWVEDKVIHTWMPSITNPRAEIEQHIKENPGLRPRYGNTLREAYPYAKKKAIKALNQYIRPGKQRLDQNSFPETCPWPFAQVVDEDWLPEG